MDLISVNPASGKKINIFKEIDLNDLDAQINIANSAYHQWSALSIENRAAWIKKAAVVLREKKTEFAELITAEMGKPIAQAEAEVEKCAYVLEHYAENAIRFLEDEFIESKFSKSIVSYRPSGVVLGIMPWNFPF
jgi:succinate-semialdehyde dehydrogenase / glutarate-semialdehyde dehydrogenase